MDAAEGWSSSGPRQNSPGGSIKSCSTSSHSSTNSERYHLASTDGTPESEEHAHYTDVHIVGGNSESSAVLQQGAPLPSVTHQNYGSPSASLPSLATRHLPPVSGGHLYPDAHGSLRRNAVPQTYSAVPRTVTATIVDPAAMSGMSGAGRPYSGHVPVADGSARMHTRHFSSSNYDIEYNSRQPPQPTLAALALADSRGHLDSGLGYYQQPHRVLTSFGRGQGFRSEPASGAGSPTNRIPDSHTFSGHDAASADNVVAMGYNSRTPPSASALGVMFSAPMAQRIGSDGSKGMDRDYAASTASEAKLRGMRYTGSATARSPAISEILHGSDQCSHHFQQHRSGFSSGSSPQVPDGSRSFYSGDDSSQAGASRSQLSVLPENSSIKSF
ncbi:hypothetical protein GGI20_006269, partial [Coemansia sp. BCRC 34301]